MILALAGVGAFIAGLYKIANTPQVSQIDITSWRRSSGQLLPRVERSGGERVFLTLYQRGRAVSFSTAQPEGYVSACDVVVKIDGDQQRLCCVDQLTLNHLHIPGRLIAGFAPKGVPSRSAFSTRVQDGGTEWTVDVVQPPKVPIGYVTRQKLVGKRWQPKVVSEMSAFEYWLDGPNFCEFGKAKTAPGSYITVGSSTLSSFLGRSVCLGCTGKPWTDFFLSAQKLFANSRDAQYSCVLRESEGNEIREVYLLSKIDGSELPYNTVL